MSGNAPAAPAGGSAAPATAAEGNKGCSSCCGGGGDDRPIAPDPTNCERGTTDCLFLLAFLAFWGGMIICAAIGFSSGDPRRLLYFVDYNGNQCGTGVNSANKYAFWGLPLNSGSNICVPKCPGIYTLFTYGNFSSSGNNYGYTVEYNVSTATCALNLAGCVGVSTSNASLAGKTCCTVQNNPAPTGFYVCVPETASTYGVSLLNSTASSYVSTYLSSGNAIFASAISDIMNGWWILLVCVLVSVVIAFLWTYVLKWCAGLFVWSCVILSNLSLMALCGASVYLEVIYKSAYDTSKLSSDQTNYIIFLISAVVTGTAALILLCMTVCLCRQLRIAVGIIQEACMAIQAAPSVLFFPLFQYIILCGFLVYWLVVAVYMASCGTYSKTTAGAYTYTFSDDMMKVIVYHFFGLLWTVSFLRHMTILILAGVFCSYYWTPLSDKNAGNYPASPVLASMWRSVRYHSGTVAFGSFLVAMVQFAQACVEYIRRNYCKEDDRLMQYLACCVQCILACFERCIEYISRNAYIVTAAKGNMFCTQPTRLSSLYLTTSDKSVWFFGFPVIS